MVSKHFLLNPNRIHTDGGTTGLLDRQYILNKSGETAKSNDNKMLLSDETIKSVKGKIVVKLDLDSKNSWQFENGMKIRYERNFNNMNRNYTQPVNCIVIDGEGITKGSEILVKPNAIHDSYRIFDYKQEYGNVRYYSVNPEFCFAWHNGCEWIPFGVFDFALQVYQPYEGVLHGIESKMLKDYLYVTTGKLKGYVVKTLVASNHKVTFQDINGREGNIIKFRPFGDKNRRMEAEALYIDNNLTQKVNNGKLLVGTDISDARKIDITVVNDYHLRNEIIRFNGIFIL